MTEKDKSEEIPYFTKSAQGDFYVTNTDAYDDYEYEYSEGSTRQYTPSNNLQVRDAFNSADYEYYREFEAISPNPKRRMELCRTAYQKNGVVRTVIDMMTDFVLAGLEINHPSARTQNFYRNWAKKVDLVGVSERIVRRLLIEANAPIKRNWGSIIQKEATDLKSTYAEKKKPAYRIPHSYFVLSPRPIEVVDAELSLLTGKFNYEYRVSGGIVDKVRSVSGRDDRRNKHYDTIFVKDMLKRNDEARIPLPDDKFKILFYKKDDDEVWATPFLVSVLSNIADIEKMHQCDRAALDGAISNVRLWRLGSLDPKCRIIPKKAMLNKVRNILKQAGHGGTLDMVWGPELDFKESNSQVHHYLTSEKFRQNMAELHAGLGVPSSLTGAGGGQGGERGFTNNSISIRTLVERLEYVRRILIDFWHEEFTMIKEEFGWRYRASLSFKYKVLTDENTERKLLIDMWDRNLISDETLQGFSRLDSVLEQTRIRREEKQRQNDKRLPKASPYHNAEQEHDLAKISLQQGTVTPSEVGLELKERKKGEKPLVDKQADLTLKVSKQKENTDFVKKKTGDSGGRPKNAKDTEKRKQKEVKEKKMTSNAYNMINWANRAQADLYQLLQPVVLEQFNKKNIRSLSASEHRAFETFKFNVFSNLKPFEPVNKDVVSNILDEDTKAEMLYAKKILVDNFKNEFNREPSTEETREIQSYAYAVVNGEE